MPHVRSVRVGEEVADEATDTGRNTNAVTMAENAVNCPNIRAVEHAARRVRGNIGVKDVALATEHLPIHLAVAGIVIAVIAVHF